MITAPESTVLCSYTQLDNGIHSLILANSSTAALREIFDHLHRLYDGKTRDDPLLRILVDASQSGIPPLAQVTVAAKRLVAQHPNRPEVRYAFITDGSASYVLSTLEAFIRVLRRSNRVRTFSAAKKADAITWLLSGQNA
jgi:hypothetical protein